MDSDWPWDLELAEHHRLAIVCALLAAPRRSMGFTELADQLGLTPGNLACHLRRLDRSGILVTRRNGGRGRASRTEFSITDGGRFRLSKMRDSLRVAERSISDAIAHFERDGEARRSTVGLSQVEVPPHPVRDVSGEPASIVDERFSGPD